MLSLLAGEDMYGYQMILELARRSDHTFEMKEGTLYPVLHGWSGRVRRGVPAGGPHWPGTEVLSSDPPGGGGPEKGGGGLEGIRRRGQRGAPVQPGTEPGLR